MRHHIFSELPGNYSLYYHFNVRKDFDILKTLSRTELLVSLSLILLGLNLVPVRSAYRDAGSREFGFEILVVLIEYFGMMYIHENLHHLTMKAFGSKTAAINKSLGGGFSYSEDYFDKFSYLVIALVPFTLLSGILIASCCFAPAKWFWAFYALIIFNTSGSLTDFFALCKIIKAPQKSLILDSGLEFKIFSMSENNHE